MFVKLTIGVWLISTLIFFYFFIFDAHKDGEAADSARRSAPRK